MIFSSLDERLHYESLRIRRAAERLRDLGVDPDGGRPKRGPRCRDGLAVGVCHPLRDTDLLIGAPGCLAFFLAKGGSMRSLFTAALAGLDRTSTPIPGEATEVGFLAPAVEATIDWTEILACAGRRGSQEIIAVVHSGADVPAHVAVQAARERAPLLFLFPDGPPAPEAIGAADRLEDAAEILPILATIEGPGSDDPVRVSSVVGRVVERIRRGNGPGAIVWAANGPDEPLRRADATAPGTGPLHRRAFAAPPDGEFEPFLRAEIEDALAYAFATQPSTHDQASVARRPMANAAWTTHPAFGARPAAPYRTREGKPTNLLRSATVPSESRG